MEPTQATTQARRAPSRQASRRSQLPPDKRPSLTPMPPPSRAKQSQGSSTLSEDAHQVAKAWGQAASAPAAQVAPGRSPRRRNTWARQNSPTSAGRISPQSTAAETSQLEREGLREKRALVGRFERYMSRPGSAVGAQPRNAWVSAAPEGAASIATPAGTFRRRNMRNAHQRTEEARVTLSRAFFCPALEGYAGSSPCAPLGSRAFAQQGLRPQRPCSAPGAPHYNGHPSRMGDGVFYDSLQESAARRMPSRTTHRLRPTRAAPLSRHTIEPPVYAFGAEAPDEFGYPQGEVEAVLEAARNLLFSQSCQSHPPHSMSRPKSAAASTFSRRPRSPSRRLMRRYERGESGGWDSSQPGRTM